MVIAAARIRALRTALALLACAGSAGTARAGSAILIWPVNPTIPAERKAGAVWLENQGDQPAVMQIRLFGWTQAGAVDRYTAQEGIVASPPMATIAPGARQLIRLTDTRPARQPGEEAFRIVVDEIPTGAEPGGTGVRFQMRYSLPLFVTGTGAAADARPHLSCTLALGEQGLRLRVRNTGPVHARLANARLGSGRAHTDLPPGLLGYALPGGGIDHAIPQPIARAAGTTLHAEIAPGRSVDVPCD